MQQEEDLSVIIKNLTLNLCLMYKIYGFIKLFFVYRQRCERTKFRNLSVYILKIFISNVILKLTTFNCLYIFLWILELLLILFRKEKKNIHQLCQSRLSATTLIREEINSKYGHYHLPIWQTKHVFNSENYEQREEKEESISFAYIILWTSTLKCFVTGSYVWMTKT